VCIGLTTFFAIAFVIFALMLLAYLLSARQKAKLRQQHERKPKLRPEQRRDKAQPLPPQSPARKSMQLLCPECRQLYLNPSTTMCVLCDTPTVPVGVSLYRPFSGALPDNSDPADFRFAVGSTLHNPPPGLQPLSPRFPNNPGQRLPPLPAEHKVTLCSFIKEQAHRNALRAIPVAS
jgi:hypothetical protein